MTLKSIIWGELFSVRELIPVFKRIVLTYSFICQGPAFIFSVVSFGILANFTRKSVDQRGLLPFEIPGLCLGSLTYILLPVVMCISVSNFGFHFVPP